MDRVDGSFAANQEIYELTVESIRQRTTFKYRFRIEETDLLACCRMLNSVKDFDARWAFAELMLKEVPITVLLRGAAGTEEVCQLPGFSQEAFEQVPFVQSHPCVLNWLVKDLCDRILKDVSEAWEASKKAATAEEDLGDEETRGPSPETGMDIIRRHFGEEILFFCYDFMAEIHMRPRSFMELFEYLRYSKTKGVMKSAAIASIKAGGNGNG